MPSRAKSPGYASLRSGRRSEAGRVYFLTTVAYRREALFASWDEAARMSRLITHHSVWPGAELLCWVLMPDHWHGLVRLADGTCLVRLMKHAKGTTARAFNQSTSRNGPVWQDGFHDRALRREDNLRAVARYLVANPLRAGLVPSIGDYPFWNAVWLEGNEVL